jgi:HEAT repeat protein
MLETQMMNSIGNKTGAGRRTFFFAIAVALTIVVGGFNRSALAQQSATPVAPATVPAPATAPAPAARPAPRIAPSRSDLIDDDMMFRLDEKAIQKSVEKGLEAARYIDEKAIQKSVEKSLEKAQYTLAYADAQAVKYAVAAPEVGDLLNKYKYNMAFDANTLFAPGAKGIGAGMGMGIGRSYGDDDEKQADDDPCEFKIVVLQALIQNDQPRGVSVATEWLKPGSTQTLRCKGAALTLLARHGGKAVTPVILGVARNETDVKLRSKAISVLGASNDESVIDTLRDFALSSADTDISEAALYALSQHTSPRAITVLGEIASSSTRPLPLRKAAISSISSRPGEPAVDVLLKIYDSDQNVEIRKSVIRGFSRRKSERAGAKLLEIARGSDNIELRKEAISGISRRSGEGSLDIILGLYDTEKNEELRDQIINSLGNYNDQRVIRKLIEIARNPQTPIERRKRAIGSLSRSKDPEVLKFLEDLLK